MLSVVIPVYNVEAYLDKCIGSVVNQTYKDLEIIIVNDGSKDNSGELCKKWASYDERIIYIEKNNEGSGKTRNLGIEKATGEYITFLDSDDWWREDYAELMLKPMVECDVTVCDINYIDYDEYGNEISSISKIRLPDGKIQMIKNDVDIINKARTFLWGKVFRREVLINNKIEQPTMAINDIPITTILVAKSEKICRVGEPLYNYLRMRAGNTVTSPNSLKSFGDALVSMRDYFGQHGLLDEYKKSLNKMYYSQYRFAMKKALMQKDLGKITVQEYDDVKKYLENILYDFWKECPRVEEMKFLKSHNKDINEALRLLVIDEKKIIEEKQEGVYIVKLFEENDSQLEDTSKIYIEKNNDLLDDDRWWDMADQILFNL